MADLLTAFQMRAIEAAAIESGTVSGLELMERAGAGVVAAAFQEWPDLARTAQRAVVLCGPGNNGGDGFVVARLLRLAGWQVDVFLLGDAEKLPPDARTNYDRWRALGDVTPLGDDGFDQAASAASLVIDALFGTGLVRPLDALPDVQIALQRWRTAPNDAGLLKVVCVDVPSGLCSDSGVYLGGTAPEQRIAGHLTVTFHSMKCGHVLASGPHACGKIAVCDIGLAPHPTETSGLVARCVETPDFKTLDKHLGHHKFSHGHALVVSGGPGQTGAARLAARGALRIGAGLVTLGVPPSAQLEVASQITALMLTRIRDGEALAAVLQDARITALCLGPGLGLNDRAANLVDLALSDGHLSMTRRAVLDADALSLIAQSDARMAALNTHCVLTPHGGEFARLFPEIAARLSARPFNGPAYSKIDATRDAAVRCGAVVLFKGPDTVIAHPDGRVGVHVAAYDRAAPWLATAGAGDVLAGFVAGLLARGIEPFQAANMAAWLHVECARQFGPGLIAEDLPEALPQVLRHLQA